MRARTYDTFALIKIQRAPSPHPMSASNPGSFSQGQAQGNAHTDSDYHGRYQQDDRQSYQQSNYRKYRRALAGEKWGRKHVRLWGHIVAAEIDRNPDRKWGIRVASNGRSMCLRAGHCRIFLMSLGASRRVRRLLRRQLHLLWR